MSLPTFSSIFATILNAAKKTQPNIDMSTLEGRSFAVAIDEMPQDISIRIENDKVIVLDENEIPDVTISGSLKAIVYMINNESNGLENDDLYISGKIGTARQFQQFLASFSLDWQVFFAQFMSDNMANKTAEAVEQSIHIARGGAEKLGNSMKDYLLNESNIVVSQSDFDDFAESINLLHQRIDKLSQQFNNDSTL